MVFLLFSAFAVQPQDLSNAMSIPSGDIVYQSLSADVSATAVPSNLGIIYPTDGSTMAELYTGMVGIGPQTGTDLGIYGESGDRTTFTVQLHVPSTANSMMFDFYFLSAEYPEYVNSDYNDKFEANISGTAYSGNAATDSLGNQVDVNSAFFTVTQSADLQGTMFDGGLGGGTGWLTMIVPVNPNDTVTVSFTIYDVADGIYDSMVLLDNFEWSSSDIDVPAIITPILLDYISPKRSSIEGGIQTSVYGEDFNGTCQVYFDGTLSPQTTFVNSSELRAVVPPHAAEIVDVHVVCDGVEGTLSNSFTYFDDSDGNIPPSISNVQPYQVSIDGGEEIQVWGSDFVQGASIEIDGVSISTTFVSSELLNFMAPAHDAGFATLLVSNPDGLYDEISGALYYNPSVESSGGGTQSSSDIDEGDSLDGTDGTKEEGAGCNHVASTKEGIFWVFLFTIMLGWRKER